jgi:hypothetical protein
VVAVSDDPKTQLWWQLIVENALGDMAAQCLSEVYSRSRAGQRSVVS